MSKGNGALFKLDVFVGYVIYRFILFAGYAQALWLYLLFLNLFCQDMQPFYVPGNADKIPFALHCLKSA